MNHARESEQQKDLNTSEGWNKICTHTRRTEDGQNLVEKITGICYLAHNTTYRALNMRGKKTGMLSKSVEKTQ